MANRKKTPREIVQIEEIHRLEEEIHTLEIKVLDLESDKRELLLRLEDRNKQAIDLNHKLDSQAKELIRLKALENLITLAFSK